MLAHRGGLYRCPTTNTAVRTAPCFHYKRFSPPTQGGGVGRKRERANERSLFPENGIVDFEIRSVVLQWTQVDWAMVGTAMAFLFSRGGTAVYRDQSRFFEVFAKFQWPVSKSRSLFLFEKFEKTEMIWLLLKSIFYHRRTAHKFFHWYHTERR